MTLTALADAVGVTVVNLSIMKNQRAKAVRFSTLTAICDVLQCTPGSCSPWSPPTLPDGVNSIRAAPARMLFFRWAWRGYSIALSEGLGTFVCMIRFEGVTKRYAERPAPTGEPGRSRSTT